MRKVALLFLFIFVINIYLFAQGNNYALEFNDEDYVELPSNLKNLSISGAFTITVWINTNTWGSYRMFFQDGYSQTGNHHDVCSFYLGATPHHNEIFICIHTTDGRYYNDHVRIDDFGNNKWSAFAYIYDGSEIRVYYDGNLVFSEAWTGNLIDGNANMCIGYREWENPFIGFVDELRIWNIALTVEGLRESLHRCVAGDEEGLVGYWRFDEGSAIAAGDSSINNNDGILFGPEWVVSTAPVGFGANHTEIVSSGGSFDFLGTGIGLDFIEKTGTDTIVATVIENESCGTKPTNIKHVTPKFWVVRKYGNGTFTANLTFTLGDGAVRWQDLANIDNLKLLYREYYSDSDWVIAASASSATSNSVTFEGVTSFGQFTIGTMGDLPLPVELGEDNVPRGYRLFQNRPNPFNPATTISYTIPKFEFVTLKVYDARGREIDTLVEEFQNPGTHSAYYNAQMLRSGVYLCRIKAGQFVEAMRMIVTK